MIIKKFYNAEAGSDAGGSSEGVQIGSTFNLGDFYSQQSQESAPSSQESSTPDSVPQSQTETKVDVTPVESQATPEKTQAVTPEPAKETTPASTPENINQEAEQVNIPVEVDWKEALKGKERREVLEALGVDNLFIDMLDYHQNTGDIKDYLDIKTKDWDKVSDLDIMRYNLRKEYADLSDEKFEKIFKADILNRFNVGEDYDAEDRELGEIRLSREALKVRDTLKAEQAGFKIPDPKPSAESARLQEIQQASQKAQSDYDAYVKEVNANEITKKLIQDKKLVLGEGDQAYKFEVDPKAVVDAIVDTNKLFASCINQDGSYNLQKAYKLAAYASQMETIEKSLIAHGMSLANKEFTDQVTNPTRSDGKPAAPVNESLPQAFVSRGTHTTLGSILGG